MKRLIKYLAILVILIFPVSTWAATFTSMSNTGANSGSGNWADGATWLKATETSLTVTVAVGAGNVTFTRSAGDWTTNLAVGNTVVFSGLSQSGNNNVAYVATNVTALVLTAVQGPAVAEGPTGSVTAKESFVSPGVQGTDYPGTAADVANIGTTNGQTHTVTYNLSNANELGTVTVGNATTASTLYFSRGMSTLINFANTKYLTIAATGYVDQGHSGDVIPAVYTSEIRANPTAADSTTGIKLNAAGAKITAFGDPAYYGSVDHAFLTDVSTNSQTFIVGGDVSAWPTGSVSQIYVHKGAAYVDKTSDINGTSTAPFTLASATYNVGTLKTTLVINEAAPTGVFAVGARVVNAARNVVWSKSGASTALGNQNTYRFYVNGNNLTSGTLALQDMMITGSTGITGVYFPFTLTNVVFRNANYVINSSYYGTGVNLTAISHASLLNAATLNTLNFGAAFNTTSYLIEGPWNTISGNFYSNALAMNYSANAVNNTIINANIFGSGVGVNPMAGDYINCRFGYDENNAEMDNGYDIDFAYNGKGNFKWCKLRDIAGYTNFKSVNTAIGSALAGYFYFEHFNQTLNDHRVVGAWGSSKRVVCGSGSPVPTQRSGGSADSMQLSANSNCSTILLFKTQPIRIWFTTGTAKTYRFYVQTDYAADALVTEGFKLYANYTASTGLITAATPSTQNILTRTGGTPLADWSQYVEVTVPSNALTGWVDLYFQLMQYASGKYVWIDPKVVNP
jgi:hypothetical protein